MRYLKYNEDGIIKRFPIEKDETLLGRDWSCDLILPYDFISQQHAIFKITGDSAKIIDMDSKNGVWIGQKRVKSATILLRHSFRIGHLEFFFLEGGSEDFKLSQEVKIQIRIKPKESDPGEETRQSLNIFKETLIDMLAVDVEDHILDSLFETTQVPLEKIFVRGSIFLAEKIGESVNIIARQVYSGHFPAVVTDFLGSDYLWGHHNLGKKLPGGRCISSFPLSLPGRQMVLFYIIDHLKELSKSNREFLELMAKELSQLFHRKNLNIDNRLKTVPRPAVPKIITKSGKMLNLLQKCHRIADSSLSILIQGESGTGKELFAKFIHAHSRREGKYIDINCSAIPENLLEAELFGHEKGAFTDAKSVRIGKLEEASAGVLVLDEIGDMPLNLQAKLLRVLQEHSFYRLGGNQPIRIDLRVIALTHRDIYKMIREGQFREDLFFRIANFTIDIPPLRERPEDIIPLVNHFVRRFARESKKDVRGITTKAIEKLTYFHWPGNVRQLESVMRVVINFVNSGERIDHHLLNECNVFMESDGAASFCENEKQKLLRVLEKNQWNKSKAAEELELSRTALYKKMKKHEISY